MRTTKSPSDLDKFIGQRIRAARLAIGLSQEGLADKIGLTFQQVQKYEKGVNRIAAGRLYQVAQVLGCPLLWLYGMDQDTGVVPTPNQMLAERIAQLGPEQRAALEQMAKAMLEVAPLPIPDEKSARRRPSQGRPQGES